MARHPGTGLRARRGSGCCGGHIRSVLPFVSGVLQEGGHHPVADGETHYQWPAIPSSPKASEGWPPSSQCASGSSQWKRAALGQGARDQRGQDVSGDLRHATRQPNHVDRPVHRIDSNRNLERAVVYLAGPIPAPALHRADAGQCACVAPPLLTWTMPLVNRTTSTGVVLKMGLTAAEAPADW